MLLSDLDKKILCPRAVTRAIAPRSIPLRAHFELSHLLDCFVHCGSLLDASAFGL